MSSNAPLIDPRTAESLGDDVATKLATNVPEWLPIDPHTGEPDQASAALIGIVARFGEIVIERLNQAPDKNFLAFLDLLGTAPLPPEPARVPLTFTVSAGSATDAVVPAGTQVAAAALEGETAPVTFETERELTAIAANLQTLIAVDADRDLIGDRSGLLAAPVPAGVHVFAGDRPNEHVLYVAHETHLANPSIKALTLQFTMTADSPAPTDARVLQWEAWDGVNGTALTPTDTTQNLAVAGAVTFANLAQIPEQTLNDTTSRWLRCRLATPVSPGATPAQAMVRAAQLPVLSDIRVSAEVSRSALAPDAAFTNGQAIDVTTAFLPFGDRPKIGDVFYLGHREALGQPGGAITIEVTLANPTPDAGTNQPPGTQPSADLQLKWEVWDGTKWALLGLTTRTGAVAGSPAALIDDTKAFSKSNTVRFTLPPTLATRTVNGVESYWTRVQIVAGNYGVDALYVADDKQPGGFRLVPATFAAPLVSALALSYDATLPPLAPDAVVAFNGGQFDDLTSALAAGRAQPFVGLPSQPPAFYAGFTLPTSRKTFPNRTVSLYHGVRQPPYGEKPTPLAPEFSASPATAGATITHHFSLTNTTSDALHYDLAALGGAWTATPEPAHVTLMAGLSTDIKVSIVVPPQAQLPAVNASDRGFLTLHDASGDAVHSVGFETRVGTVVPRRRELRYEYWNGTGWAKLVAADGTDLLVRPGVVEFLGPADFAPSRQFGVIAYWIRGLLETGDDPPVQLRTLLLNTTIAANAVTARNEVLGSSDASASQQFRTTRSPVLANPDLEVRETSATWVQWTEVADFYASGPQDRHYVLDHLAGSVRFGDGVQGKMPPRGVANVRMASYQTGGGEAGNRAAETIVQLKTTVPYVESVTNFEAADGGVAPESTAALVERAPRALRHGGRAVAIEDYEDLARSASAEVARAKAVPLRDLRNDPLSSTRVPGAVSVVIVPLSDDPRPTPSVGLMAEVEDYVRGFTTPTASLAVVGPLYVRVDVSIEVALVSLEGASEVEDAVRDALSEFLHPLTGGRDGAGWDFGRQPFLSDLYAVVSSVAGVDHIRELSINQVEEPAGAVAAGRFLVYSGHHQITLTFVGAE